MITKYNSEIPADERRQIFHESYGDDFDAGWTLMLLVIGCGNYLARIVGEETAKACMSHILDDFIASDVELWPDQLLGTSFDAFSEWPLGQELHDLTAYAVFGIVLLESASESQKEDFLKAHVQTASDFFASSPIKQWGLEALARTELELLVMLAKNRWALDHGEPVEPAALAYFGGISEGSIRNMMSGDKSTLTNDGGRVPAQDALAWLATRPKFWNSVWREQPGPDYTFERGTDYKQPVFVPVSRDGSVFHPGLDRSSGFTIGPKGAERQVDEFFSALSVLQSMPIAYWRRPNKNGHFGTVKGVRWERLEMDFLWSISTNSAYRLPDSLSN